MKGFKRLLSTLIIVFALGCASTSNTSVVETSDGSFAYSLSGAGEVVIVLESGLGDDMSSWDGLPELLRQHAQVFTYNRAGFAKEMKVGKAVL
ncbi:MAG: hypothetical protein GJ680_09665 [Alteromonadaceae bacterium]|nr:hypothetical protein [Alteromonadaceae bacterium]